MMMVVVMMMVMMGRAVLLLPYLHRVGVCEKLLKRAGGGGRLEVDERESEGGIYAETLRSHWSLSGGCCATPR